MKQLASILLRFRSKRMGGAKMYFLHRTSAYPEFLVDPASIAVQAVLQE
jgi:hypothetical protein